MSQRIIYNLKEDDLQLLESNKLPYESIHAAARRILLQAIVPLDSQVQRLQATLQKFGIIEGALPIEYGDAKEPKDTAFSLCNFFLKMHDENIAHVQKDSFLWVHGEQLYVSCPMRGTGHLPINSVASIGCTKWGIVLNAKIEKKKAEPSVEPDQEPEPEEGLEDKEVLDEDVPDAVEGTTEI